MQSRYVHLVLMYKLSMHAKSSSKFLVKTRSNPKLISFPHTSPDEALEDGCIVMPIEQISRSSDDHILSQFSSPANFIFWGIPR